MMLSAITRELDFAAARRWTWRILVALFAVCASLGIGRAQENRASDTAVIRVAERMYCPVCENIPLDECQTTACLEWKDEIAAQLAAGRNPQEVINSFVARFGDHVVGVPQDPLIRALTFALPLLATLLALGIGLRGFRRFAGSKQLSLDAETTVDADLSDASYRQRLEQDLRALR